jgi:hypothetical protein
MWSRSRREKILSRKREKERCVPLVDQKSGWVKRRDGAMFAIVGCNSLQGRIRFVASPRFSSLRHLQQARRGILVSRSSRRRWLCKSNATQASKCAAGTFQSRRLTWLFSALTHRTTRQVTKCKCAIVVTTVKERRTVGLAQKFI